MAESPRQQLAMTPPAISVWASNRPKKKTPEEYVALQEKYVPFANGNEFLTIPEALESVSTRTLSLFTNGVVTRRLIGASRDTMKEARSSNAMWDTLLACEEDDKKLAGVLINNSL